MANDLFFDGVSSVATPNITPLDYPTVACTKCGHKLFQPRIVIKEIPGTLVGNGVTPVPYPLQVMVCANCGKVMEQDVKLYKLEKDFHEED